MTLYTVTITGVSVPVEVYGGLTACKDWLGSSSTPGAVAFNALADDSAKGKVLVDATRYLDAVAWAGTADAAGGTTLQWPRSGVVLSDGTTVDSTTVPAAIVQAAFELAGMVAADNETTTAVDAGNNIQQLNAKGTSITFFSATSAVNGTASVMPIVIQRLVGKYLALATFVLSGSSNGTTECASFDDCDSFDIAGTVR